MKYEDYVWDFKDSVLYEEKIKNGAMPPVIVSVAITGGIIGKEANPNLPETPEEQVKEALACYRAGASIVHIHARDPNKGYASASANPDHYYSINKAIREACPDIIINNTTGGGFKMTSEERLAAIKAKPEVASLNCGPLFLKATLPARKPPLRGRDEPIVLDDMLIPITVREVETFAEAMTKNNVKPELEIYNAQHFNVVHSLIRQGLLKKPYWYSIIFSTYLGGIAVPGTIRNFLNMLDNMPSDSMFQVIGVGLNQIPMITMSMIVGGHVRVGFEDNLFYKRGQLLTSTEQKVKQVVQLAEIIGREVATPKQTREMLGISQTPSSY
jgi:3-keto-5-aminohexanoate cleavage enzyme